jgi:hypothetical protein
MPFRATAYQKRLEEAGFDPKMAHAQAAAREEFVVSELVTSDQFNSKLDAFEVKLDARLDTKLATLRSELKSEISVLEIKMTAMQMSLIRWMLGTVGGATLAIIVTLLRVTK